jgi:glutamyl-tRNA reductase
MNPHILLVGAGYMAVEYAKVLKALAADFYVVGRSQKSAAAFLEKTEKAVELISVTEAYKKYNCTTAIVAVNIDQLFAVTNELLQVGCKKIL